MRTALRTLFLFLIYCVAAFAQEGGNRINQGQQLPQGKDITRRQPTYPSSTTDSVVSDQPNLLVTQYQFVDAKVLTSLETKGYVAVFGLMQEADKVSDANKKLQEQINTFLQSIAPLGIRPDDTYVDFVTQERVYDTVVKSSSVREKSSGFQIKENLMIRYKDHLLLDRIVPLAAQAGIFDLIKVDYITEDLGAVRARMTAESQKVIQEKVEAYTKLGIKLTPVSIAVESFDTFQPAEAYNSYHAFETGSAADNFRVVEQRKNSTVYFEALSPGKFDAVLTPIDLQPRVQATYFLRIKYFVSEHTSVVAEKTS
ncbi:MAG TPA: hypothetical protein VK210_04570 [Terriglobia bacterium]|nr:hypothetical protein [Terriglobia bacterium]